MGAEASDDDIFNPDDDELLNEKFTTKEDCLDEKMNEEQDRNNDLPKSSSTDSEEALNNETKCDSLEISKNQENIEKSDEKTIPEVKPVDSTSQEQNTIAS